MAMTVKTGDVVKVTDTSGYGYQGNHTAGHVGVVTALHSFVRADGSQCVNIDDEKGAPFWIVPKGYSMLEDTAMLLEDITDADGSRDGDVLVAHKDNEDGSNSLETGDLYTLHLDSCGCCGHAESENGYALYPSSDDYWFINLSALKRQYQTSDDTFPALFPEPAPVVALPVPVHPKYNDMTDEAKGAILLASHENRTVQFMSPSGGYWVDDMTFDPAENFAYRVKTQALIDAESRMLSAIDNVYSLEDALIAANEEAAVAATRAEMANDSWRSAEWELAALEDEVVTLRAA